MAQQGLHPVIQKEIQRLKKLELSQRQVTKRLGINRKSVRKYWDGEVPNISEAPSWVSSLDWEYINSELNNGITREVLYKELSEQFKLPNYQNFCKMVAKKIGQKIEIIYKIERFPGESVEVDYAGNGIPLINPATGEIIKTELFVSALSYSKKIFGEFTYTQGLEDFIGSHNKMYQFYGGVPGYAICDNLKSGVTKSCKLDPLVNKTYHELAIHYNVVVDPADVRKARHKPNVEKAVDILQRGFMAQVRNKTYTSLGKLNQDLRQYLKEKNSEKMRGKGVSRDELFEKEKQYLKKLPSTPYKIAYWKLAKVHPDCHIQHKYNFYSVPHTYVGKQVEVKYTQELIEIFLNGDKIACHKALKGRSNCSTNDNHYPDKRLVELQINYQRINKEAERVGPDTGLLIRKIFNECRFPLKKLRRVQAILSLGKKYGKESLEYASGQALEFGKWGYHFIASCAKNYRPQETSKKLSAPQRELKFICLQGGYDE